MDSEVLHSRSIAAFSGFQLVEQVSSDDSGTQDHVFTGGVLLERIKTYGPVDDVQREYPNVAGIILCRTIP